MILSRPPSQPGGDTYQDVSANAPDTRSFLCQSSRGQTLFSKAWTSQPLCYVVLLARMERDPRVDHDGSWRLASTRSMDQSRWRDSVPQRCKHHEILHKGRWLCHLFKKTCTAASNVQTRPIVTDSLLGYYNALLVWSSLNAHSIWPDFQTR